MKTLPFMKTIQDAIAICEKEQDGFHLTAFMLQAWVGQLIGDCIAEYAEKKNPRDRNLQTGQAWTGFFRLFEKAGDDEFPIAFGQVCRFAEYDADPMAARVLASFLPLSYEHEFDGDYIGPRSFARPSPDLKSNVLLMRRTVERLCDWLDALIHLQINEYWHLAPQAFDPDPEKRELASLGINQRHLASADDLARAHWQWHFSDAAEKFKDSPKWKTVGEAMAAESDRAWLYPKVDGAIISFWPLVKKHNWTYCDLMNVVREATSATVLDSAPRTPQRAFKYPLDREQDFATYCNNVLSLRKTTKGVTARTGHPPGYEVAKRLITKANECQI